MVIVVKFVCFRYGYVTPSDVPELLDNHIVKGEIIDRIWRGQMGVPVVKKAEKAIEQSQTEMT
ncbi:putative thioredoxin-like ferredoxin, Thioredoxin-like superfamily [Helianthus annuus]|nr:putative thioredoxin-like ferredoxin, Thioredoxin-like superfamily [Helianthus annuus]